MLRLRLALVICPHPLFFTLMFMPSHFTYLEQVEIYDAQIGQTFSVQINPRQIVTPHPSTGGQPYALVSPEPSRKTPTCTPASPTVSTSSSRSCRLRTLTVQGQNLLRRILPSLMRRKH